MSPSSWRCCKVSLSATHTDFPPDSGMPVSSCWVCAAIWPLLKGQASGEGKDAAGMQGSTVRHRRMDAPFPAWPVTSGGGLGKSQREDSTAAAKAPSPPSCRGIRWLEFSVGDAHTLPRHSLDSPGYAALPLQKMP